MLESVSELVLSPVINEASSRDATNSFQEQRTSVFMLLQLQIQPVLQHQPQVPPHPSYVPCSTTVREGNQENMLKQPREIVEHATANQQ
ncbi:hypothetical protein A2U01_0075994, partial [Trifolium medium]|nr:hypothetical protein [Trifolium medium]